MNRFRLLFEENYFELIIHHYNTKYTIDRNIISFHLSKFAKTHGEEAISSIWKSICWSISNMKKEEQTYFQNQIYIHDIINGCNKKEISLKFLEHN